MKRRRILAPRLSKRLKFIHAMLVLVIFFTCVNTFFSLRLLNETQLLINLNCKYFLFQFTFIVAGLIFITTLVYIMHYGFGAIFRMEKILEKIAKGDYSLRIRLRKKDFLRPLAKKLNVVLDDLEKEKNKAARNKEV